jgi:hypothetical protein
MSKKDADEELDETDWAERMALHLAQERQKSQLLVPMSQGYRFKQYAMLVEKLLSQMLETEDRKKRLGYTYSQERINELKQVLGKQP